MLGRSLILYIPVEGRPVFRSGYTRPDPLSLVSAMKAFIRLNLAAAFLKATPSTNGALANAWQGQPDPVSQPSASQSGRQRTIIAFASSFTPCPSPSMSSKPRSSSRYDAARVVVSLVSAAYARVADRSRARADLPTAPDPPCSRQPQIARMDSQMLAQVSVLVWLAFGRTSWQGELLASIPLFRRSRGLRIVPQETTTFLAFSTTLVVVRSVEGSVKRRPNVSQMSKFQRLPVACLASVGFHSKMTLRLESPSIKLAPASPAAGSQPRSRAPLLDSIRSRDSTAHNSAVPPGLRSRGDSSSRFLGPFHHHPVLMVVADFGRADTHEIADLPVETSLELRRSEEWQVVLLGPLLARTYSGVLRLDTPVDSAASAPAAARHEDGRTVVAPHEALVFEEVLVCRALRHGELWMAEVRNIPCRRQWQGGPPRPGTLRRQNPQARIHDDGDDRSMTWRTSRG